MANSWCDPLSEVCYILRYFGCLSSGVNEKVFYESQIQWDESIFLVSRNPMGLFLLPFFF